MKNQSIGSDLTWKEDDLTFTEVIRQEYENCAFSAGKVEGHPVDTMYLMAQKDGVTTTFLLLRPDEMAVVGWLTSGVLWSYHINDHWTGQ
jgi:hypothetical protein